MTSGPSPPRIPGWPRSPEDPTLDVAWSRCAVVASADRREVIPARHLAALPTLVVRRAVHDRVGPFDPAAGRGEDFDWFLRMHEAGARVLRVDDVTYEYRRRAGSDSAAFEDASRGYLEVVRLLIRRRRAS